MNFTSCSGLLRRRIPAFARVVVLTAACWIVSGCIVNPVTGEREIGWVTTEQQIQIGKQQYAPAQQMQGGTYQVDPELTEYVDRVGQKLAARSPVDLPYEFVVLNNSVPNAWALPGGKIAINRGLLTELDNEAELAAVLGHEVVHAAARHGAQRMEQGTLLQGALIATMIGTRNQEYAGAMLAGAQVAAGLISTKYGRDAERESDLYGTRFMAEAGYDPVGAVTLQETFVRLSEGRNQNWVNGLFASHPPSAERVQNNKRLVAQLRKEGFKGELGEDRFQRAMRQIKKDAPAYAAYDAAHAAVRDKDLDTAAAEASKAVRLQPREAQFHGLRGDIRRLQGRHKDAITNYDRAVQNYDGFFAFYLGRGLSHSELKNRDRAKADFNRSLEIFPTAVAYNELGRIAESEGNSQAAVRYYEAAASAPGAAGKQAFSSLLKLDLPRQPAKYVKAEIVQGSSGGLAVRVVNATPATLKNITVRVQLRWQVNGDKATSFRVASLAGQRAYVQPLGALNDRLISANAYAVAAEVAR